MTAQKLTNALASASRGRVLTDEVKGRIDAMVDDGKKCKDIFNGLKGEYPTLKYQNVRSYLERQLKKIVKNEAVAEEPTPEVTEA